MNSIAYSIPIKCDFELGLPETKMKHEVVFQKGTFELPRLYKTKIYRAGAVALFGQKDDKMFLSWPGLVDFCIDNDTISYAIKGDLDEGLLRIFITSEAFGILLFRRSMFLFHGSAVKIGESTKVFIGTPGAGKSTTVAAYAKAGFTVLADDMVAINIKDGRVQVIPAIPDLKIWRDAAENLAFDLSKMSPAWEGKDKFIYTQSRFPVGQTFDLSEIVILKKPFAKLGEVSFANFPIIMTQYFPLPHQLLVGEALKMHFAQSFEIFKQAKIVQIKRPKNFIKLQQWIKSQAKV